MVDFASLLIGYFYYTYVFKYTIFANSRLPASESPVLPFTLFPFQRKLSLLAVKAAVSQFPSIPFLVFCHYFEALLYSLFSPLESSIYMDSYMLARLYCRSALRGVCELGLFQSSCSPLALRGVIFKKSFNFQTTCLLIIVCPLRCRLGNEYC